MYVWCRHDITDYTSFVKRVIKLVQTYLSLKSVELDIRAFSDDDATLDVRGQPLIASSSTTTTTNPVTSTPTSTPVTRSLTESVFIRFLLHFLSRRMRYPV